MTNKHEDHAKGQSHGHASTSAQPQGFRDTATQTLHDVRERASGALVTSRDAAADAARRTAAGIESNPLGILVGGLAVGVLAGALLPRSDKEKQLLAPVGKRLGETVRSAAQAAREAGRQELDASGLTRDAARDRGRDLLDGVVKALSSAGSAAVGAARKE